MRKAKQLVVNTNVLFSALLARGKTREIILKGNVDLYTPEYFFTELKNHLAEISERSGLKEQKVKTLLDLLFERISIVAKETFKPSLPKARKIVNPIDPDDTPFFALALYLDIGIWSNDAELKKQANVKVWKTKEIIKKVNYSI